MSTAHGPNVVTEGLVFLVDAGNHKSYPGSGTSWIDLIEDDVGTLTNVTVSDGIFNFNGSTSRVPFSASGEVIATAFDGGGCSMAWIRVESDGENSFGRVYDNGIASKLNHTIFVTGESGSVVNLGFAHGFSSAFGRWESVGAITLNEWTHVAVNYSSISIANDATMYVNGVSVSVSETQAPVGSVNTSAAQLLIVGDEPAANVSWDGDIAMVSIYNRSLSAEEIQQNYNALKDRFV